MSLASLVYLHLLWSMIYLESTLLWTFYMIFFCFFLFCLPFNFLLNWYLFFFNPLSPSINLEFIHSISILSVAIIKLLKFTLNLSQSIYGFTVLLNNTSILEWFQIPYPFLIVSFNVDLYFRVIFLFACPKLVTIISYFMQLRLRITNIFTNCLCLLFLFAFQSFL